ncbi:MAG: oligosaccharide flippase family protein [Candidatus Zixiibacteriota bacterium]|nr:MAG: oligosaccharide flippase family protein [candidate division Zixibacteria bacterium]
MLASRLLKQSLVGASVVTISANLLGRFVGFAREATIAGYFGTSATFDTFVLAFTIPELLSFVIFAALPTAIIPWLANIRGTESNEAATFRRGLLFFSVGFGLLSLAIFVFRGSLLSLLAPDQPESQRFLGERLFGILSWVVLFRGLEAYFRGWLHARKHFVVPAIAPIIMNLVVLASVLMLCGRLEIEALAIGWLAGSATLLLLNGYMSLRIITPAGPKTNSRSVIPLLGLAATVAAIELISFIYPAVDRYLATRFLGEGQIAALRYATFLCMLPTGIVVVAFSHASFPWISDLAESAEVDKLGQLYTRSVRAILFVMLFVAAGMVVFSQDIVKLAFERGIFDTASTELTAGPVRWYALGIALYSVYIYQMRIYYAHRALSQLGSILLAMLAVKVMTSLLLVSLMGHNGLALASTLAWVFGFAFMTFHLSRSANLKLGRPLGLFVSRTILPLALAVVAWLGLCRLWPEPESYTFLSRVGRLLCIGLPGLVLYVIIAHLSRLTEPADIWRTLRKRLTPDN